MKNTNPMIFSDYYKQGHPEYYPKGLDYLFTCGTARMTRIEGMDHFVPFGIQGFAQDYLIERFNSGFFNKPKEQAVNEVKEFIENTFDCCSFDIQRIADLHDLGYLPVKMWAVPEGTPLPIYSQKGNPNVVQVPFMAYESTHPKFAWVAEFLESITSVQVWYPSLIATISKFGYRNIVDKHWEKSVVGQPARTAISEFGFRGGEGLEGAIMASCGFLTSFDKTATAPAIQYLKDYYGKGVSIGEIGSGMGSTEHSVMCSNFAVDGNEDTFMHRLFTEIAPKGKLSVVSDSYDYWGRVAAMCNKNSQLHTDIINRDGTVYVRGDSGDPLKIVAGTMKYRLMDDLGQVMELMDNIDSAEAVGDWYFKMYQGDNKPFKYYKITRKAGENCKPAVEIEPSIEEIGTVEALFNGFGGAKNSKGYIVLNDKVRAIYGDSITPYLAEQIYNRLENNGFAANNVALGAGSFSMQSWEEYDDGKRILKPHTRDTFGIAFKATYCEVNGEEHEVFKQPKTDTGFKRSQRGMVAVYRDEDGTIRAKEHLNREQFYEMYNNGEMLMRPIFENGHMVVTENINDIRSRLNNNNF